MVPLTIGLPVYNGAATLERAITSLLGQTFPHFNLVVSDNASTDDSATIAERFAKNDARITVIRQVSNLGAVANFLGLARAAKTPFFMWAAADDEWSPNYIAECRNVLEADWSIGFSGGVVTNIDPNGAVIRRYEHFSGLDTREALPRIWRFAWKREAAGKANLIYSIFRAEVLQAVCADERVMDGWGGDMGLIMSALSRAPYRQATEATLFKRVASASDIDTAKTLSSGNYRALQFDGAFPPDQLASYLGVLNRGVASPVLRGAIAMATILRRIGLLEWEGRQRLRNLRRRIALGQKAG